MSAQQNQKKSDHLGRLNNAWSWGTTVVSGLSVGFLQWAIGLPGSAYIGVGGFTVIVVLLAFALSPNRLWLYGSLAVYVVFLAFGTWRLYEDAQKYGVEYETLFAAGDPVVVPQGQPQVLRGLQLEIVLGNPNEFWVNERSQRRIVSLAKQDSGDEGGDTGMPMTPERGNFRVSAEPIKFKQPVPLPASGTMDFSVCFAKGKDNTKFDKQLRMKGAFDVWVAPNGALQVGNFRPSAPEGENNGFYDGCPR